MRDYIDSLYIHMGFQSPLSFKTLIELEIKNGDLLSAIGLSDKVEEYREKDINDGKLNNAKDIIEWIS